MPYQSNTRGSTQVRFVFFHYFKRKVLDMDVFVHQNGKISYTDDISKGIFILSMPEDITLLRWMEEKMKWRLFTFLLQSMPGAKF